MLGGNAVCYDGTATFIGSVSYSMQTITTRATITEDGHLTARIPVSAKPGEYDVMLIIPDAPEATTPNRSLDDFPVHDSGPWPEGLSLRREDMYDGWGR